MVYTLLRSIFVTNVCMCGPKRDSNGNVFKSSKIDTFIYTNTACIIYVSCGVGIYKIITFARFEHVPVGIALGTTHAHIRDENRPK